MPRELEMKSIKKNIISGLFGTLCLAGAADILG
jgi:hypothetical protein